MRWSWVFVAIATAAPAMLTGCGQPPSGGPFDGLPLDAELTVGVSSPVHVARDRYGIAHIWAATYGDAAFVQGYLTAHDRLPQLDLLRRYGAGTLAELYGDADPTTIDSDLELRLHRITEQATETWSQLQASRDPIDIDLALSLQRFADGVNHYAADLERGLWTVDPAIYTGIAPSRFTWSPIDSLVLYRFYSLSQSWTAPFELAATDLYQAARQAFDLDPATPAAIARRGISRDLLHFAPVGMASTLPGFPNVTVDTGSRSDGSTATAALATPADATAPGRPQIPPDTLADARSYFAIAPQAATAGPAGTLTAHAFLQPLAGGNTFAIGPQLTSDHSALLAADLQLPLADPSALYPIHLIVTSRPTDGDDSDTMIPTGDILDAFGVTLPGIPGVMFGQNADIAWAGTAVGHDVNDLYLETISACSPTAESPPPEAGCILSAQCTRWTDAAGRPHETPIQSCSEQIQIGTAGAITSAVSATYEISAHGPLIPGIDRTGHQLAPRTSSTALAVRYTGDQVSFELRALYNLNRAHSVDDAFHALADSTAGGQGVMVIDRAHIGWTSQNQIPIRESAAYAWDPDVREDALSPFFVLPGSGGGEWQSEALSTRFIPHAVDPTAGFLVAAGGDPVGATFTGLPLSDAQGTTAGPLYAGVDYNAGLRDARIRQLIAAHSTLTTDDLAAIQRDTRSNVGAALTPPILIALARLDGSQLGPSDVAPYLAALSAADLARLATARQLLTTWTFATPAAIDAPDADSAATLVFQTWIHFFIQRVIGDELAQIGFDPYRLDDDRLLRVVYALLTDPQPFVTSPATQQPILCDNYSAAGPDDSCTQSILAAMVDAMTYLEQAFNTADTTQWRWGSLHQLSLSGSVFPLAGDGSSVQRSDAAWADLAFGQHAGGQAMRLVAEAVPGGSIISRWSLPGGAIFDSRSPHYRDLLDQYYATGSLFAAPFSIDDIVAAGEIRWVFR